MKAYKEQELEKSGFISNLIFGKPAKNAWAEANNVLAKAEDIEALPLDALKKAAKKWGVKFGEDNVEQRSSLYRKLADVVYTEAQSKEDAIFTQAEHLAKMLELSEIQVKLANKASRMSAYFMRCRKLLEGEEKLTIHEINDLFGYDYEDGLAARTQVFQDYFNLKFEGISKVERFSDKDEEFYQGKCEQLDIPYEFKRNVQHAIEHYRALWNAENAELGVLPVELPVELEEGEEPKAYSRAAICQKVNVEKEDNYFEMTRKLKLEETVTFTSDKLEIPKTTEEITTAVAVCDMVVTTRRILIFTEKDAMAIPLADINGVAVDKAANYMTLDTAHGEQIFYVYTPDEENGPQPMSDVMGILVQRIKKEAKQ